jgi:phosphoribosylaminoimidazolecarboxamide formyltransferase/IMP cyclohydrolase
MPHAVVSVYNKTDLIPFMQGLANNGWQLFATAGTQKAYSEATHAAIPSLSDLITTETGTEQIEREVVAQHMSGLMLVNKTVQLACVNLRPPRLEASGESNRMAISLDVGGIAMITAASNSGALVLTNPEKYETVLSHVTSDAPNDQELRYKLQIDANAHIVEHLNTANSLAGSMM